MDKALVSLYPLVGLENYLFSDEICIPTQLISELKNLIVQYKKLGENAILLVLFNSIIKNGSKFANGIDFIKNFYDKDSKISEHIIDIGLRPVYDHFKKRTYIKSSKFVKECCISGIVPIEMVIQYLLSFPKDFHINQYVYYIILFGELIFNNNSGMYRQFIGTLTRSSYYHLLIQNRFSDLNIIGASYYLPDTFESSIVLDDLDKFVVQFNNNPINIYYEFSPSDFDPNLFEFQRNILNLCAVHGSINIFKFLLLNGFKDGVSPQYAIQGKSYEIIHLLIQDDSHYKWKTLLNESVLTGDYNLFQWFSNFVPSPDYLDLYFRSIRSNSVQIMTSLIPRVSNPFEESPESFTPIIMASAYNNMAFTLFLSHFDYQIATKTQMGRNALYYAITYHHNESVEFLLDTNLIKKVIVDGREMSALDCAILSNDHKVVQQIIKSRLYDEFLDPIMFKIIKSRRTQFISQILQDNGISTLTTTPKPSNDIPCYISSIPRPIRFH